MPQDDDDRRKVHTSVPEDCDWGRLDMKMLEKKDYVQRTEGASCEPDMGKPRRGLNTQPQSMHELREAEAQLNSLQLDNLPEMEASAKKGKEIIAGSIVGDSVPEMSQTDGKAPRDEDTADSDDEGSNVECEGSDSGQEGIDREEGAMAESCCSTSEGLVVGELTEEAIIQGHNSRSLTKLLL